MDINPCLQLTTIKRGFATGRSLRTNMTPSYLDVWTKQGQLRFAGIEPVKQKLMHGNVYISTSTMRKEGLPQHSTGRDLMLNILRYYDEIDRNDIEAALSRCSPDFCYVRDGEKEPMQGMDAVRKFYYQKRSLQGKHLIGVYVDYDAKPPKGTPMMWVAGSIDSLNKNDKLKPVYAAMVAQSKLWETRQDRIAAVVVVQGVHNGVPTQAGNQIVEFTDIWCFQKDGQACFRMSLLSKPYYRKHKDEAERKPPKVERQNEQWLSCKIRRLKDILKCLVRSVKALVYSRLLF